MLDQLRLLSEHVPRLQEQKAEALRGGALQTFKQQISFGLHVLVMMGTFYVFGHAAGAAISAKLVVVCHDSTWSICRSIDTVELSDACQWMHCHCTSLAGSCST